MIHGRVQFATSYHPDKCLSILKPAQLSAQCVPWPPWSQGDRALPTPEAPLPFPVRSKVHGSNVLPSVLPWQKILSRITLHIPVVANPR